MIKMAIAKLNTSEVIGFGNSSLEATKEAEARGYNIHTMSIRYVVVRRIPDVKIYHMALRSEGMYFACEPTGLFFVDAKYPVNLKYEIVNVDLKNFRTWTDEDTHNVEILKAAGQFSLAEEYRKIRSEMIAVFFEDISNAGEDRSKLVYRARQDKHAEFAKFIQGVKECNRQD